MVWKNCEHTEKFQCCSLAVNTMGENISLSAWQDMSKSERGATALSTHSIDYTGGEEEVFALLFFTVSEKTGKLLAKKVP